MPANFMIFVAIGSGGLFGVMVLYHIMKMQKVRAYVAQLREQIIRMESEREAHQQLHQLRKEDREAFEEAAKASVMTVGQELSSKLLNDHKREAEAAKKHFHEKFEQDQQQFLKQVNELGKAVASIGEINRQTQNRTETLWRTMASPAAAGQLTEMGLANLLQNFGLKKGIDFDLQASVTNDSGGNFRPDALIYLPDDRLMILDCKASKYELELAEAEGKTEADAQRAQENFCKTMHRHLDALARKNYAASVGEAYRRRTGREPHPQFINVMYLSSDAAVARLDQIDPTFRDKMQKHGIVAVGPAGLHGLCMVASMQISELKRDENREKVLKEVERILAGLAINLDHLDKTGMHLKRAAESYIRFTASYNRTLSPRIRTIEALGVSPEGNRKMPGKLPVYEMRELSQWIEGEAEDAEDTPTRPALVMED